MSKIIASASLQPNNTSSLSVAVIGGGPAGLMAAEILSQTHIKVDVYDAMPSVGRKFLMAGKGGMNITHAEPFEQFLSRYGSRRANVEPMLNDFNPDALRDWLHTLDVITFVGSSGRVFPTDMKAAPLLRRWLHRLREAGVNFHVRHRWTGWSATNPRALCFTTPAGELEVSADAFILALGGGSWARLGSTGAWVPLLIQQGIEVAPLKPANCGFEVNWSEHFHSHFAGQPLKSVRLSFTHSEGCEFSQQGEIMITADGVEGGLIYAASALLREAIAVNGFALIHLDLTPERDLPSLIKKLSAPRGKLSLANYLRKRLNIDGVKANLLREILTPQDLDDPAKLCASIKALPIKLMAARPLDEAISSAGGVTFEALDEHLMTRALPGVFCAGEMLDWEAPTGGYLLSQCFASGRAAGLGALAWLQHATKY
ncbi:MAG: TIGR03862 family flavoprotein [Methylococcaceae bacterium]